MTAAESEFAKLITLLATVPPAVRDDIAWQAPIDDQSRNPRDVLTHVHAWHLLTLGWYEAGERGEKPAIPGPGLTWRDLPTLNARIWTDFEHTSYGEAVRLVTESHQRILDVIDSRTDTELFTKKLYPWTGTTSLGAYLVSASSSHYVWAIKTVKAQLKTRS